MSQPALTLEMFAEHIHYANPFDANRVTQTDSLNNDVPKIHADEFEELKRHARQAARSKNEGRGVVVTGRSGVGKSHLMARFGEWARQEKYPFVYLLNLQAGPDDILRTILRTSISILTTAKSPEKNRLFQMVSDTINAPDLAAALALLRRKPAGELHRLGRAYDKLLDDQLRNGSNSDGLLLEPIYKVLWQFFEDVYGQANGKAADGRAELAISWLAGGYLEPDEARRLKLDARSNSEDGCTLDLDQMTKVLKVLSQFAGFRDRSLILCFDQVDNFREDQVQAWSTITHTILDIPRLLVVTSGVDQTFVEWTQKKLVKEQSWEPRIRQFYVHLSEVDADLAQKMVHNRLQESLGPFAALTDVADKRKYDPLFPIGEGWRKQTLLEDGGAGKKNLRPRDVINRARAAWESECKVLCKMGAASWLKSWPHGDSPTEKPVAIDADGIIALIDQKVEAKLAEHRQTRFLRPEELPPNAGNVLGLLKSMLSACENANDPYRKEHYGRLGGFTLAALKGKAKPAFQMIVEHLPDPVDGVQRKIGVVIADASRGRAATNILKRILDQLDGENAPDHAVLVVDGRERLTLAEKGQEHLENLKSRTGQFSIETLDFEQYATLDAFEGVVSLARARDLEAELPDGSGRRISEAEVYDSHHRKGRYLTTQVLCRLVGKCVAIPSDERLVIDRQKVLEATYAQLALNLGLTTLQLTHWWIEHQQPKPPERCHAQVHTIFKEVVLQMHDEGKVTATATNDYYMVLPTKKLMGSAP